MYCLMNAKKCFFFLVKVFSVYNLSVDQVNHGFFKCKDRNQLPLVTIGCSQSFLSRCLNFNDLPSVHMQFNRKINIPQQLAGSSFEVLHKTCYISLPSKCQNIPTATILGRNRSSETLLMYFNPCFPLLSGF